MITILSLYCDFRGWEGGTIHQVIEDFDSLDVKEKVAFCNIISENKAVVDDYNFKYFACGCVKYG